MTHCNTKLYGDVALKVVVYHLELYSRATIVSYVHVHKQ